MAREMDHRVRCWRGPVDLRRPAHRPAAGLPAGPALSAAGLAADQLEISPKKKKKKKKKKPPPTARWAAAWPWSAPAFGTCVVTVHLVRASRPVTPPSGRAVARRLPTTQPGVRAGQNRHRHPRRAVVDASSVRAGSAGMTQPGRPARAPAGRAQIDRGNGSFPGIPSPMAAQPAGKAGPLEQRSIQAGSAAFTAALHGHGRCICSGPRARPPEKEAGW